ncbi:cytochrome oxidase subunit III [Aureimonas endophytica]|uniref:Cytochrome oxidase subunit III n=1 Tax=Aureimonas endophytica TaxID=2027858 RepID=A0A916ZPI4_9HYPH|nr:cytochrome c oxidase subunit 3 family protein [Aureimonas endophytica]GGE07784.1 cytochrome oxidase subunit III [Aureimonas endophytica]
MSAGSALNEPFEDLGRQRLAARFGMWCFLASEILFFGSLFLCFLVYRQLHPNEMLAAGRETNIVFGSLNTAILLASSVTMAVADKAAEEGLRRDALRCLGLTAALGLAFLVVKGFEYREDVEKHLWPGPDFAFGDSPARLFYGFYWTMTGVHALHLTIGIATVALVMLRIRQGRLPFRDSATLPVLGLYWHLVDIVWIFLYPLLYLGGRAGGA